ncbi:MAG TPA: alpha/beta hydrolase [Burkholderiales bacterium]|nr:alpha/beta hydrolase [Burkholderiales bacterium]
MKVLALLLAGFAASAAAQEVVTLQTRPGVTLPFFIADMGGRKPEAAALLLIGGGGNIRLGVENGKPKFNQGNFLPRSRREFIRNGILPVILDNPTDQQAGEGMSDDFRESAAHVADIRAVRAELAKRYPGLPVFVVGTSRSTLSAAHLAKSLPNDLKGAVLTSSLFYSGVRQGSRQVLAAYNWGQIKIPLLVVHHQDDACGATPYFEAKRLASRYPLITVHGGKPPESAPCEPFANHGYFGKEAETVDAIAAWMLGKPVPKEIR